LIAALFGLAAVASAGVVDLTPDNFDSYINGDKGALVEFFAPWCGHCKRLEPEYEKVAAAFSKFGEVLIAKVDADQHKDLGGRFAVKGFPTLKWFPKGSTEPEEYSGGREADDLISFVNGKAGVNARTSAAPSDVTVLTPANFDEIVNSEKDVLVEFYAPWCGHCKSLAPVWDKLATAFKNEAGVVIAKVDADAHKDIASKHDVSGFPTLKFFSKYDKTGEKYESGRDLDSLVAYINEKAGTNRKSDGRLNDKHAVLEDLTSTVSKFIQNADSRAATLAEAENAVAEFAGETAKHGAEYVRAMKAIIKNGSEHLEKEIARITGILSGSLSAKKVDEFTARLNVLNHFKRNL